MKKSAYLGILALIALAIFGLRDGCKKKELPAVAELLPKTFERSDVTFIVNGLQLGSGTLVVTEDTAVIEGGFTYPTRTRIVEKIVEKEVVKYKEVAFKEVVEPLIIPDELPRRIIKLGHKSRYKFIIQNESKR